MAAERHVGPRNISLKQSRAEKSHLNTTDINLAGYTEAVSLRLIETCPI